MIAVLGAGIAGLGAYRELADRGCAVQIFEKGESWGGLCGGFSVGDFWFDNAIHLSFASGEARGFFDQTGCTTHIPNPYNYYHGHWLKHPAQNNLYRLPPEERAELIAGFVENSRTREVPANYDDWLRIQFGDAFAERFPLAYTRKYWRCNAKQLSVNWITGRMYQPCLREVLLGAFSEDTPITYYAKEMRYPKEGRYKTFLRPLVRDGEVQINHEAVDLDLSKKTLTFANGGKVEYRAIVSSLPLPTLVKITKRPPDEILQMAETLEWTSVQLVSLAFGDLQGPEHLWDYYYDEDFYPARSYSPSLKSPNNAPPGCSSMQFEVYVNQKRERVLPQEVVLANVLQYGSRHRLFDASNLMHTDVRTLEFGNVVFLHGMETARDKVRAFYRQNGVYTVGRFGEWDYLWSDQALMSGRAAAANLLRGCPGALR